VQALKNATFCHFIYFYLCNYCCHHH